MKARIENGVVHSPYPAIDIPICSIYDLMREKLLLNPQRIALVDDKISLTRGEMLKLLLRYAVGFRQHGVLPGDRICVHLKNSAENLIAMYGCVLAGATIVLAKSSLTEGELRYQAQDSDSIHILTDEEQAEKARNATISLGLKGFFCMGRSAGFISASEFTAMNERDYEECPVTDPQNTVIAVCYTSGTTGLPKGADVTHYNYVCSFYIRSFFKAWEPNDVLLSHSPITHQSGMMYNIFVLLLGATCVVTRTMLSLLEIMDAVDKYKATGAIFFPAQLQALVREMQRRGRGLPSMRGIVVTGSVLPNSVAEDARNTFVGLKNLLNVYAMTESCGLVFCQATIDKLHGGTSVGFPTPMAKAKVLDVKTGEKLGPYETGEICYCTPSMVKCYYKRLKENDDLFDKHGWLKSGDCGYYDEDGRFYIVERLKQMIKCMGNQVVPAELEQLLLREHGADIAEVSVVGLPNSELGEVPAVAVILTDEGNKCDRQELAESIKDTVRSNLAVHKQLYGGVFFLDALPKTETAKVNRPALARALLQG